MKSLSIEDFADKPGQDFTLIEAGHELTLTLRKVEPRSMTAAAIGRTAFSLLFNGPAVLHQQTYVLTHPNLGRMEIFLAPVGPDDNGGFLYQAVFN